MNAYMYLKYSIRWGKVRREGHRADMEWKGKARQSTCT